MTIEDIDEVLALIDRQAAGGDHQAAHALEDALHRSVLTAIANGETPYPATAAATALRSQEIRFLRGHA